MSDQPKRLQRNTNDQMIAGVASGVADYFGVDRSIVRVLWALSVLFGGLGVVVYVILWIVVPEAGSDRTVADDLRDQAIEFQESRSEDSEPSEDTSADPEA